jgi:hypothetical protein
MMRLVFIYGPAASGKLTIARELAERTGMALFHNHLIVDAVGAVFPFGSEPFVRLRESFWTDVIAEAAAAGRSLIFTFAPEPTVTPGFAERIAGLVRASGGETTFVALSLPRDEQERRLVAEDRALFGKLRSVELLRSLHDACADCTAAMPGPDLAIDTASVTPSAAADAIIAHIEA